MEALAMLSPHQTPPQLVRRAAIFAALALGFGLCAQAQTSPAPNARCATSRRANTASACADDVTIRNLPRNFLHDQAAIWTSPRTSHARPRRGSFRSPPPPVWHSATDHYVMSHVVSKNPGFNQANINASNAMIYGLVATPVVFYGLGHFGQEDHAREAGILAG